MAMFAQCGVDLLLAGHLHVGQTGNTAARYAQAGHAALVVHAGTATSTRGRGQANSFNVIRVEHPVVEVQRWEWDGVAAEFSARQTQQFRFVAGVWTRSG